MLYPLAPEDAAMDTLEIDKLFEKLRKAGHGSIIKFDATGNGQLVEGIIFEPGFKRPAGFEKGVFVSVPSDRGKIYYFDPDASKEQGRVVIQKLSSKKEEGQPMKLSLSLLEEYEYIRQAPDIKMGGGAVGEDYSKYKGIFDLEK